MDIESLGTPTAGDPGAKIRESLRHSPNAAEEQANARTDRAELQHALEVMPQAVVSEADLHKTPWHHLGFEFALNIVPSLMMAVAGAAVLRFTPPLPFQLKYVLVPVAFILAFGLIVCLVDLVLAKARNPHAPLMAELPLLQAVLGKRILKLETASDVYIFAHTLERKADRPGAFVGLVANPQDPEAMQKVLTVGGVELLPGNWKAVTFHSDGGDYTAQLQKASVGYELYPSPSQVVERWLFKEKDSFKVPCFVELQPANGSVRLMFLWRHWAVRVCFSALILFVVITPIINYLGTMHRLKHQYCNLKKTDTLPFCEADEDGNSCEKFCDHLLDFMGEVGSRMGVEEIEIIWTVVLAVVFVYCSAIMFVRTCHEPLETKFILGTSGITRTAMAEVVQVGKLLNDSLSIVTMASALRRQTQAYRATLTSCSPMVGNYFRSQNQSANPCLQEVMKPVKDVLSGKATPWPLHLKMSSEEHYETDINGETRELKEWAVKMSTATQDLSSLKNTLGLTRRQSVSRKDCMFSVAVPITCREALDVMKQWMLETSGPHGYADQVNAIFRVQDCQDKADGADSFCHVTEDFRVGPLFVPAGVCLTHICCETPDMDLLTLQVGLNQDVSSKELFELLFYGKESAELNNCLALETYRDRFQWPPIMLPSAAAAAVDKTSDDEGKPPASSDLLATKLKDTYIYKFYFVFQLSPAYFKGLQKSQEGDVSLYGFTEGAFTRLAKAAVQPTPLTGPLQGHVEALKQQSWKDAACSEFCLVAEEDKGNIYRKILGLCGSLGLVFGLAFLCLCFALIVPCFRHFRWGGEFFPAPFTGILIFNAFQQFLCLFFFFWLFTRVTMRLNLVCNALQIFEAKSLAPSPSESEKPLQKKDEMDRESEPFRLYMNETRDYDPTDNRWAKAFRHKERNLLNWQRTACWLRLFVSGSRLTAQAVLVGSAGILLLMFLIDVSQALRGTGAFSVNDQVFLDYVKKQAMGEVQGVAAEGVTSAANAANGFVEGQATAAAKAATARRLFQGSPDTGDLSAGARTLAAALAPIEEAIERVRQRQLVDVQGALNKAKKLINVGDVQMITQAQLLTIFMAVLLLFWSCYLLSKIAFINDHVDKHENMLVQVKEQHLQKQSIRDRQAADKKASGELKGSTEVVEQAQTSYNKTLDMVIESAHANRSRFPLALFGFIITQGLLMAWLCAAVQPLVQELSKVVPTLAESGCEWLGNSGILSSIEDKVKTGLETVFREDKGSESGLFYSLVCVPLLDAMRKDTAQWNKEVNAGKHANNARRLAEIDTGILLTGPRSVVDAWWDANPGSPDHKLALVHTMLEERSQTAQKLLVAGPEAVLQALETDRWSLGGQRSPWSRSWLGLFSGSAAPLSSLGEL